MRFDADLHRDENFKKIGPIGPVAANSRGRNLFFRSTHTSLKTFDIDKQINQALSVQTRLEI